ncbi:SWIM zinc finger family protein [Amphritea sp. 1_MG-2023]|uniref:SWIM zinc finger family protein n=1 Tax=Amphritea sp. 1_MG-2023 TaxID=3062670 RepID=UPI0026E45289|nr:SWIM zinc finger family protein [Amphritea sp. 1_MG-2023]MDO6564658.1 SWIM zinc finger family protein [Amphritea sp. 1_MG-2023]
MKTIKFLVEGSSPEPYLVTFTKDGDSLNAFCTCPAGENGQYCKHRLGILSGSKQFLVCENKEQVSTIQLWLLGSDLEAALRELAEAEHEHDHAKNACHKQKVI